MEQLLDLTHAALSNIIASSPLGMLLLNNALDCEYSNLKLQQMLGLTNDQLAGKGWFDVMHKDDRKLLLNIQTEINTTGDAITKEIRFKNRQNQVICVKLNFSAVENDLYCCIAEDITAHKRVAKKFNDLQSLIESTNASIFSFDSDFNYTAFNQSHKKHAKLGRGVDIKLGDNYLKLARALSGIDVDKSEKIFQRVMAGESVEAIEEFGEPTLHRTWFSIICNPLYDEHGNVNGMGVFCQDITERVLLQEENTRQQQLMQTMLDSTEALLYSVDRNGNFTSFNKAAGNVLKKDMDLDLYIGGSFAKAAANYTGINKDGINKLLERVFTGSSLTTIEEFGKTKETSAIYSVQTNPIMDADGSITGTVVCAQNITEVTRLQKENEEKTRLLNSIVNSTSGPMFAIDLNWNYIFFNKAYQTIVKKSRNHELKLGDNYMEIKLARTSIDMDKTLNVLNRVIAGEKLQIVMELGEPDLYRAFYDISYDTLRDCNGNVTGVVVFSFDISERLTLQNEIDIKTKQRTEELESWNNFNNMLLSVLAHDLRQPFSAIVMTSELLKYKHQALTEEELSMILMDLNDTATKSIEFLQGLLYWVRSKKEGFEYKSTPLLLHDLVMEANSLYQYDQHNKNITFINEIPENQLIYAHHQMMLFICRNLISNATKYSSKNGVIRVYGYSTDAEVVIVFEDKGKGISMDMIERLFTTDEKASLEGTPVKGAGIALTIAFNMMKQMDGKLWVESELNKGASFYLSLPKRHL